MAIDLKDLKRQIIESVKEHSTHQKWDSFLYNASVIIAIILSAGASFMVDYHQDLAKILSALAAIVIAIDRSLNWGARWIFQRQMRQAYLSILARIDLVENLGQGFTDEEKKRYFLSIFDELLAL